MVQDLKKVENDKIAARMKLRDDIGETVNAVVHKAIWYSCNVQNGALVELKQDVY